MAAGSLLRLYPALHVSTHSHPKVAATYWGNRLQEYRCFNTQPPEGGCFSLPLRRANLLLFQHTATRRWLPIFVHRIGVGGIVSTHSHPKVAARLSFLRSQYSRVSTHSHPKVAAQIGRERGANTGVSTHSHPKVAASGKQRYRGIGKFQHTATRRWLLDTETTGFYYDRVSTHSHPKVAATPHGSAKVNSKVSTHSHPKVAAYEVVWILSRLIVSTHSHPKVAARTASLIVVPAAVSTHSHPKVAAKPDYLTKEEQLVSTHSHPKVAAAFHWTG